MPRGQPCVLCLELSRGRDKSKWHREVTEANALLVRTCMIAYHGDECGTLADKVKCGAKVCTECWPTEEIQLLDGVLGACVAVQAAKELRRGRVSGLRVPGSWQRHAESSQLSERLRDPGEARIFEVKFEDRAIQTHEDQSTQTHYDLTEGVPASPILAAPRCPTCRASLPRLVGCQRCSLLFAPREHGEGTSSGYGDMIAVCGECEGEMDAMTARWNAMTAQLDDYWCSDGDD